MFSDTFIRRPILASVCSLVLILAGLIRRRNEGTAPFTVMSCDNIPGNGHVTSDAVSWLASANPPMNG